MRWPGRKPKIASLHQTAEKYPEYQAGKLQVSSFIIQLLIEYTSKTLGIKKVPEWEWNEKAFPPYFDTQTHKLEFSPDYILFFLADPEKTKRALRWVVAHEYWHYVQWQRGEWVKGAGLFRGPTLEESTAVIRATMLSGIGNQEGLELHREVIDETLAVGLEL